jgi:hypothetical protein
MIPKLQTSAFGLYSSIVTTSGAIQNGIPTLHPRFSVRFKIRVHNPKLAAQGRQSSPVGQPNQIREDGEETHSV